MFRCTQPGVSTALIVHCTPFVDDYTYAIVDAGIVAEQLACLTDVLVDLEGGNQEIVVLGVGKILVVGPNEFVVIPMNGEVIHEPRNQCGQWRLLIGTQCGKEALIPIIRAGVAWQTPDRDQVDVIEATLHKGRKLSECGRVLFRREIAATGPVFIADSPESHVVRQFAAVVAAKLDEMGIAGSIAILDPVGCFGGCASSYVGADVWFGADPPA